MHMPRVRNSAVQISGRPNLTQRCKSVTASTST